MIAVGVFQLDVERRVLKGADGEVELSPLASRLLRLLAERPGVVVSRNELIDALWSGNYLVGDPGPQPADQRNAQAGAAREQPGAD